VPTFAAIVLIVVAGLIVLAGLLVTLSIAVRQQVASSRLRGAGTADR
jgi:hypothetical protein